MDTITAKGGVKTYVGSKARIVSDADGKVLTLKAVGTKPTMTFCPSTYTMKVGTDAEVTAEKVAADVRLAAAKEAAK